MQISTYKNRVISVLLVFVMIFCTLPMVALAANASISVDPDDITLESKYVGYTIVPEQTVTVTNDGDEEITGLSVALDGAASSDFMLDTTGMESSLTVATSGTTATNGVVATGGIPGGLATEVSTTFTVKPKSGLAVGDHSDTINITADNGVSKSIPVSFTVSPPSDIPVTGVSLDKTSVDIDVGETETLNATVEPNNATDKRVTWESSDTSIATVSVGGLVTGVKVGTTTITATTVDGEKIAQCSVTVNPVKVSGVILNKTNTTIPVDSTETLIATVSPNNAANKSVTWKSSDTSVATVSASGLVKGIKAGTATITVTTVDGEKTAQCSITVTAVKVSGVSLNKTSTTIAIEGSETLIATVNPNNATNKSVTWKSSDSTVATVDAAGLVKGIKAGTAIITVTTVDGAKTAQCSVTVSSKAIQGTAYLLGDGGQKVLGGTRIYIYTNNFQYVGSATTDSNGKYSYIIPSNINATTYNIIAWSDFILDRLRLNENKTAIETDYRSVSANALAGVDFYFVNPPQVRGVVVDSITNERIADATVYVWDGVSTRADGTFLAQGYIYQTGQNNVSASVNKAGYYSGYKSIKHNLTIDELKNGTPIDIGEIAIAKINSDGVWGDHSKNNLMLVPNTVSSGEISNATVNLFANQSAAVSDAKVKVTADSGAEIKVTDKSQVRITVGGVKVEPKDVSILADKSEMIITLDIQPQRQYQITFGIKAPTDLGKDSYVAQAFVNNTLIGKQTAVINNLTVTAPAEVGFNEAFTVYGEVVSSSEVKLELVLISPSGEELKYTKDTLNNVGFFYKFNDVKIPSGQANKLPEGEYTVLVKMYSKQGNNLIAEAKTTMRITDKPVSVKAMLLSDDYNTVSVTNPAPGSFLTFVGWVGGDLWSFDWRNLQSNVTINNADQVASAKFVMHTTHGIFRWNAQKNGSEFSAKLTQYQGTGKATVSIEITKLDGSVITYTIGNIIILIDPSGYVYDKITGKRIEGATAELYYKDDTGNWSSWPAEDYMQVNPQKTDNEGAYGWMVSEGEYEVRVTAPGYHSYSTLGEYGIINVLPERKDINIGLTPINGGISTNTSSSKSSKNSKGGSYGGGGISSTYSNAPNNIATPLAIDAVKKASAAAKASGAGEAIVRFTNPGNVSLATLQAMVKEAGMPIRLQADSMSADGKSVEIRIILDPDTAVKDLDLSGSISNNAAASRKSFFEKWFNNTICVISLGQQESFGMSVKIAAKVNLSNLDTKNLIFYSYDKASNKYVELKETGYHIDNNGYVHFNTSLGGDIIITDKPLAKK